ncbi:MAG: agmatinase family protein [Acidobacteriota bacterium]|nr:agmatinase family protein [Acidobacteriota bacterium]
MQEPPDADAGLFGCQFDPELTEQVIIGVPWEPTASYGRGASQTPERIIRPSHQLDFFDGFLQKTFGETIGMLPLDPAWQESNRQCIALADPIIAAGGAHTAALKADQQKVNAASRELNRSLYETSRRWLSRGKAVGVLGGDHSSPLGHMKACLEKEPGSGVLHLDAHHDLRNAYEGFTYSHASIMYNLLTETPELGLLVSVGIRDYCEDEAIFARRNPKVTTFYDRDLKRDLARGVNWAACCEKIIDALPKRVYISFDIDGCTPDLCPHTGTPVPGGLSFDRTVFLLEALVESGRRIIGFDLCEVAPDTNDPSNEWDMNVGARFLYKLCVVMYASNRK